MKRLPYLFFFFLISYPGFGDNGSARLSSLTDYLGQSLETIVAREGLPDKMYTVRGPSEGQDSVVFFYNNRISLFWAESYVWQIRADKEYLSQKEGLKMGISREELIAVLGEADLEKDDYLIYTLPQKGYPVSCALYFNQDRLSDLYVYRSDF